MKRVIFSLLILGGPVIGYGQNDYMALKDSMVVGIKLQEGHDQLNSRLCRMVEKNGDITEYSPDEVSEYGFENGRIYVSQTVVVNGSERTVFLERLADGALTLYYLHRKRWPDLLCRGKERNDCREFVGWH